jgi:hypothetical protein
MTARRAATLCGAAILAWGSCAIWNSIKPLPPGTRVASLPARLAESQVDFLDDETPAAALLKRETAIIGRAEEAVVVDQSPLPQALADALLLRKRQRPNLKVMLVTDPRDEAYGGTPVRASSALERAGIVIVRPRLERLRDSDPLYSSLWRLSMGWWSNPFDEMPGGIITLRSALRRLNVKSDQRHLMVADDGAGGWTSIVGSGLGVEIRGHLAGAIVTSELQIAEWSTDEDRLPAAPRVDGRGVGTIDARLLTEGAIEGALRDAVGSVGSGDSIEIAVREIGDRQIVDALSHAAARGARVRLLLDTGSSATRAAAGELRHAQPRNIEVRWRPGDSGAADGYTLIHHGGDVWVNVGATDLTRRGLDDLDLASAVELRMPARAAAARSATLMFAAHWSKAAAYAEHADESRETYWRYRIAEATGLPLS